MIGIFILYGIFSAMTFVNSAIMIHNPYPLFVGMIRALFCGLTLMIYNLIVHKRFLTTLNFERKDWLDIICFGLLIHGFVMSSFSFSIQYISPLKICYLFTLSPFITMFLDHLIYGQKSTRKQIMGLVLGTIGILIVLMDSNHGTYAEIPWHKEMIGIGVTIISTIAFAYGWIVLKQFLKRNPHHPLEIINSISMLIGGATSTIVWFIVHTYTAENLVVTSDFYPLVLLFASSSLITYLLYPFLLKTYSPTFLAFASFLEPAFGLLYGVLWYHYPISMRSVSALSILIIGLYCYYIEETKQQTST